MPTNNDAVPDSGLPSVQGPGRTYFYVDGVIFRFPTEAEKEEWKKKEEECMRAAGFVKIPVVSHRDGSISTDVPIMQFKD